MGERFPESAQVPGAARESVGRGFEQARHSHNFYELGLKNLRQSASERKITEEQDRAADLAALLDSGTEGMFSSSDLAALPSGVEEK